MASPNSFISSESSSDSRLSNVLLVFGAAGSAGAGCGAAATLVFEHSFEELAGSCFFFFFFLTDCCLGAVSAAFGFDYFCW